MGNTSFSAVRVATGTANQVTITGTAEDPIFAIATDPIIPGTGSITIPHGTTGQRVLNGIGSLRVNTTTGFAEISVDGATWVDLAVGGGGVASVSGTLNRITSTGGVNPVIDIAATYVGQASITTLGTITTGIWHGTAIDETHGGTNQTTYTLGDTLYASAANTLSKLAGNITNVKQYLSQTGTGAVSAAPSWATISGGDITGAALTKTDDTNVTLTLGGTPATALLRAASITAGWTGQLSLARGGTNADLSLAASNGGIVWSNATQMQILAGTVTASKMLLSGSSASPSWSTSTIPSSAGAVSGKLLGSDGTNYVLSTATFPVASATAGKIIRSDGTNWVASTSTFADTYAASTLLYSNGANAVTGLATANSASLVTTSAGVPVWSGTMTNGQVIIGSTGATPTAATLTAGTNMSITNAAAAITLAPLGTLISVNSYTTNGTFTWNRPTGCNNVMVQLVGAGGGGGGASSAATSAFAGGSGGGGGGAIKWITSVAASVTVTVGAGGTAGANTGTNGGTGGTSSFGASVSATGGTGGGGITGGTYGSLGTGGVGSSGDINIGGGNSLSNNNANTGGGAPGGGSSMWGNGVFNTTVGSAGVAGNGPGAGGSGAIANHVAGFAGAAGNDGAVLVWNYS